ncbi:MAG: 50S ribosomal protein L35 [Planctomycetota bacterium]|nr:50S ribosomal protein L35 [Planctomycetota bacterium]
MPKLKGKDSFRERFKVTARGKVLHAKRGRRHLMASKNRKRLRQLRKVAVLDESFAYKVRKVMSIK